ncbi:MAG: tetratricopeptide repeat protein [Nitrospirae bacterium]|nr:tetratricopeptide repeat protein [Nitrospirota bacterium]
MSDKAAIVKEAQKYLARGQIDKAIAEWEKLGKEFPDATIHNTIGDLYLKKGDKNAAIDSFHKAAHSFRDEGFSLKALALYKKILNINPSNAKALYALGELSEEKGLATDAIKYYLACSEIYSKERNKDALLHTYDKILNLSPSNIPLRIKVAEHFIKEGLNVEAAKEYTQIARLYEDKEDFENAAIYFGKAHEFQPGNKDALLGLGSISEKTGDIKQSLEYIKQAVAISPEDVDLSLRYVNLLIRLGSFADAISYVSKIIEAEPSNVAAKKLRGEIYLKEGNKQKAWEEYNTVIDEMVFEEKIDEAISTLIMFKDTEPVDTRKKLVSLYRQKGDMKAAFGELVFLGDYFAGSENKMFKEALNCYQEALQIHPEDAVIKEKVADIEKEFGEKLEAPKPEKSVEESIAEADIFLRYGLYDEARALLESLKLIEPENTDVHMRLKTLFVDTGDKEQAVTECFVLAEIYSRAGDIERKEAFLSEAYEIRPEDPRLPEKMPMKPSREFVPEGAEAEVPHLNFEDYSEDMAEAEFYVRQGLTEEARVIYQRLLKLFPENEEIKQKLSSIEIEMPESVIFEEEAVEKIGKIAEETSEKPIEEIVAHEVLEAQEFQEPTLENDVLDIFEEFKKGLEKELGTEDSETHYNLGIAYKEMGLIDDAIHEFQISKNDPQKFVHSASMLGICYMSKGLFTLAIDAFSIALKKIEKKDESYWGVTYDLAEAYEKNVNRKEALTLYTGVYGWNSKFRNVAEKINMVKEMIKKESESSGMHEKQKIKKERVSYL